LTYPLGKRCIEGLNLAMIEEEAVIIGKHLDKSIDAVERV
jgi:hypothetical protein